MKYIRYKNKKFLVSPDNWKTVLYVASVSKDDVEEKDEDNVYIAKLRYELKEPRASLILKELQKIKKIYKEYSLKKISFGDALEVFSIAVIHNLEYDECLKNNIVIGNYDGKIDAIFWDENENKVYQIKNSIIGDDVIDLARDHINQFISKGKITDTIEGKETGKLNKDLLEFCKKHENDLKTKTCKYWSVSINRTKNNYTINKIYDMYFSNSINYGPKPYSNITLKVKKTYRENDEGDQEVNYASSGNDTFMFVQASEIIKQLNINLSNKKSLERVFGYNVRKFLGKDTEIQKSIKNDSSMFVLYNNGISIIGKVTPIGDSFEIKKPFFVNGQQTILNLIAAQNDGIDISSIVLPVFIKNVTKEEDILAIAKYNNTQKPIKPIDLLSLDINVRNIQNQIFFSSFCDDPDKCYALNIYTSGKKDNTSLRNKIVKNTNQIGLVDFVRLYSCLEKPQNLGEWKNSPTKMIKQEFASTKPFDKNVSLNVCKSIAIRKKLCNENKNYTYASVMLEYLLYKLNFDENKAKNVIDRYIYEYYNKKKNKPKNMANIFTTSRAYNNLGGIYKTLYGVELI